MQFIHKKKRKAIQRYVVISKRRVVFCLVENLYFLLFRLNNSYYLNWPAERPIIIPKTNWTLTSNKFVIYRLFYNYYIFLCCFNYFAFNLRGNRRGSYTLLHSVLRSFYHFDLMYFFRVGLAFTTSRVSYWTQTSNAFSSYSCAFLKFRLQWILRGDQFRCDTALFHFVVCITCNTIFVHEATDWQKRKKTKTLCRVFFFFNITQKIY